LVGEHDHGAPPEMSHAMKQQMPKAVFFEIPNAGHISNVEQPAVFNQYLVDFYKGNGFL
jgi:3-oxoadipate enol-lactonase